MDKLLKIRDVADRLNVNQSTVYAMAQAGEIPAFKVGGSWRVRAAALEAWMLAKEREPAESVETSANTL